MHHDIRKDARRAVRMEGFRAFLLRGNLVDLAVAVVIGVAFNDVVHALINDLITPLIAAIGGKPDFAALYFTVNKSQFKYGAFLNSLISFLIIAAVVYFLVVKPVSRMMGLLTHPGPAADQQCPECLSQIPAGARRCKCCTAGLPAS